MYFSTPTSIHSRIHTCPTASGPARVPPGLECSLNSLPHTRACRHDPREGNKKRKRASASWDRAERGAGAPPHSPQQQLPHPQERPSPSAATRTPARTCVALRPRAEILPQLPHCAVADTLLAGGQPLGELELGRLHGGSHRTSSSIRRLRACSSPPSSLYCACARAIRRAGDGVTDAPLYRAWGARVAVARVKAAGALPEYVLWEVQVRVVGVKISWGQISSRKTPTAGFDAV